MDKINRTTIGFALLALVTLLALAPAVAFAQVGNIDPVEKNAWAENAGWLDFRPNFGGVTVGPTFLSGYAWSENVGWVKLGSNAGGPYANTTSTNWGVNHSSVTGDLTGFGWSENAGWIRFGTTFSTVNVNNGTLQMTGYAWSENVGWIHFRNAGAFPYGVKTTCDNPAAAVSGTATICAGSSTSIQAALTGTAPWTVTWSDGPIQSNVMASPATRSVSPGATITYSVTTLLDAFCSGTSSGSAVVTVNPIPAAPLLSGPSSVCTNAPFTLSASSGYTSYQWYQNAALIPGATLQTYSKASAAVADSGTYTATSTLAGCTSAQSAGLSVTVAGCAAPTVATITPGCANVSGGRSVTITGTNFQAGAAVTLAGTPAVVNSVAAGSITATTGSRPASPAVMGNVVVTNPDSQTGTLVGGFTYGVRGDANNNGGLTPSDASWLNDYFAGAGPPPAFPCIGGDANATGSLTPSDASYLNDYFAGAGPAPGP